MPLTPDAAMPLRPLGAAQFSELIQHGDTDMQFVVLALKGSGHDSFAQPFDAFILVSTKLHR